MMDQIKQLWAASKWWQKILLVLVLPVILLVVWVGLRRGETFPQPDTTDAATQAAKAEAARQAKEAEALAETRRRMAETTKDAMKRRQEIETARTSEEMKRLLDEELRR